MAKPVHIQSAHISSTPGSSVTLLSYVVRAKSAAEPLRLDTPLTILAPTAEEGVDYPFFTRAYGALDPTPQRAAKRRKWFRSFDPTSLLGMSHAAFEEPPSTDPLFFTRSFELPGGWRSKRRKALLAAGGASWHLGQWAERIPASAYGADSCTLLSEIQRHLLEDPIDEGRTWSLWTAAEVLAAVSHRVQRFLLETGLVRTRGSVTTSSSTASLPSDLIELRRAVWEEGGSRSTLLRTDPWQLDHSNPTWHSESGTPTSFYEEPLTTLRVRVAPAPSVQGTLELVYVARAAEVTSSCVPLALPAAFTPYVKWGVLADLLSGEGERNDPERAAYCQQRWEEGIELARLLLGVGN